MTGWVAHHLPALLIVVPLLGAPACLAAHRPRLAWGVACACGFAVLAGAALLLVRVLAEGEVAYALGGWAPPWGIEYRIDAANAFVALVVSAVGAVTVGFARRSIEAEVAAARIYLVYTAWMLCLAGLLGITLTGDAFNVFVFLEISSLSSYVLVSFGARRGAVLAAFRYLVAGTVGASFILIAVGLLYAKTGTLNMADLAARLPAVGDSGTVLAAFGFLVAGIGLKVALFPLHAWLPGAYTHAPSAVTAFLAGTATKVAVYVLLRFFFTVFGLDVAVAGLRLDLVLMPLALAGVLVASAIAIFQADVKRMLAYSSIAQVGYMVLGASFASGAGLAAGVVHVFNHALTKTALFLALGCVALRVGGVGVDAFAGLGRRMPWTMAGFVVAAASLMGVPLTAGFVSKWYLLEAALERGWWPVAALVVVGSLMAMVYTGRVIEAAYFREPRPGSAQASAREAPLGMLVPLWALVGATVYFGVDARLTAGVAWRAARALLGDAP